MMTTLMNLTVTGMLTDACGSHHMFFFNSFVEDCSVTFPVLFIDITTLMIKMDADCAIANLFGF